MKLTTMNWIEHPSRNGDLEFFGELNYKTLFVELAQGAHHFDFRSIKRVMSVINLLEREFVSSMMIPCAILLQPIYSRTGMTSARFKNSSATVM